MDERLVKALKRVETELEECMELFESVLSLGVEGGADTFIRQALRQSLPQEENVDASDISIEDAVALINEKLQKCVRLVESLSTLRYRVRHYVTQEKYATLESMWQKIVKTAYSALRRGQLLRRETTREAHVETLEIPEDKLREVISEAEKKMQGEPHE